ncbi:MAG: 2-C-methyl-D-erythritol 2,4-cyclodiphosphate synthase [Actinobacteria bacterium RBG_16_70_17]|nr:MAG: 2-C-methyl-D-erythritol 2,4-cyclodiphosphate synthase [Actinobacteria bacterium RBG_16_70_17]
MRVGWGTDVHRFGGPGPMKLGGVVVDESRGVEATSDGDVLAHAAADALLGAAALGDLGDLFPSGDTRWRGADSMALLAVTVGRVRVAGYRVSSIDVTVIAEKVRVSPHREAIRHRLAEVLEVEADRVSVKATSTDGLGFLGRDEGLAAVVVVVLAES